ncbi:MAG: hypothetical protein RBG13Loki_2357 [Promethearchaeota archaeon CR_4]|nr:MAG: hypothetical protein RBG13Loki_2357 [Candidatus Lokiarchaeota archaeon CR_4]
MIKIVLAGLDNAGKSSILLSVNRKFSHLPTLSPTKGSVRTRFDYFGRKIIGFDLGGQKDYRDDYLTRPELFFAETDLLFYIIDMQDPDRYEESGEYFGKIIAAMEKLNLVPKIVIILHKVDPDLHNSEKINQDLAKVRTDFEELARQHTLSITFCTTSIFDHHSIDAMFSIGFRLISSITGIIEKLLVTYYETTSAHAIALLDSENLVLGSYSTNEKEAETLVQTALVMQTLFDVHKKIGFEQRESFELSYANSTFLMEKVKDVAEKSYYLWILTKDLENARKNLPFFKEDLFPIVGYFFTTDK